MKTADKTNPERGLDSASRVFASSAAAMFSDPKSYSLMVGDYKKECQWALDKYKHKMKFDAKECVLDVGCATGETMCEVIAPFLKEDFSRLIGVDISKNMVEYAKANWKKDPKIDYVEMDIATKENALFHIKKNIVGDVLGFHRITSFFCFEWVKKRKQMLFNLHSMLHQNGTALILIMTKNHTYQVLDDLAASEKWKKYVPEGLTPFNEYKDMDDPCDTFANDAESVGFAIEVEIVDRLGELTSYTSTNGELKMRVRAMDPILPHIPEELQEEYLEEHVNKLRELDQRGPVDYECMCVFLTRIEDVLRGQLKLSPELQLERKGFILDDLSIY